jgi:hypothetical protein
LNPVEDFAIPFYIYVHATGIDVHAHAVSFVGIALDIDFDAAGARINIDFAIRAIDVNVSTGLDRRRGIGFAAAQGRRNNDSRHHRPTFATHKELLE